jgi:hypothetical protein
MPSLPSMTLASSSSLNTARKRQTINSHSAAIGLCLEVSAGSPGPGGAGRSGKGRWPWKTKLAPGGSGRRPQDARRETSGSAAARGLGGLLPRSVGPDVAAQPTQGGRARGEMTP